MPFEEKLPEWNAPGIEPPASKKNTGWTPGEKPPAEYWNWQMNRTYKVLQELQQKAAEKVEVQQAQQTANEARQTANEAKATADAAQSDLSAHASATTGVHGATSAATANTIVQRDSAGRFKAAAPAASDDVARKAETDAALAAAAAAQAKADAALPKSGGEVTGNIRIEGGQIIQRHNRPQYALVSSATNEGVRFEYREDQKRLRLQSTDGNGAFVAQLGYFDRETGELYLTASAHKAWHAGNLRPNVNAVADTIVQRDSEGNIRASKRIYFSNDDFIEFDDSTNTYSFKDDSSVVDRDSNIRAGRIRLTVTSDASETSTNHAFQIGPSDAENFRADTNELIFVNNGVLSYGHVLGSVVDIANSLRGNNGGNAQAKLGSTWYDILHAGNFPYETGNWTPELRFGVSTEGITYAFRAGRYTRIANVVYWSFEIVLSSKGSVSGAASIAGLPFKRGTILNFYHAVGRASDISVPSGQWLSSYILDTTIELTTNTGSFISSTAFANNSSIRASGFYFIS